MVLARNNQEIPLLCWITLRFLINTGNACHEFGVVKSLPLDMLTGGEFLRPQVCQSVRDAFGIEDGYCDAWVRNKEKMKEVHDPQL